MIRRSETETGVINGITVPPLEGSQDTKPLRMMMMIRRSENDGVDNDIFFGGVASWFLHTFSI